MEGVGLELSRELLLASGMVSLGFLDAEHQEVVCYLLRSEKLFQNKVLHHNVHLLPVVCTVCSTVQHTDLYFPRNGCS